MTDYFALLDEPRRPWLDAEVLKAKFLARSTEVHPDRVHQASDADRLAANQRYTEINAAYNCLREPRSRLRHLLELELGTKPSDLTDVPNDLMELFFSVGKALREADAVVAEKARATSPLLQVQMFEQAQAEVEKLNAIREKISARREVLLRELQELDSNWKVGDSQAVNSLLRFWRLLSFYDRWLAQIQERTVQLSF